MQSLNTAPLHPLETRADDALALVSSIGQVDPASLFKHVSLPLLGLIVVAVTGWFAIVRIRAWMREGPSNGGAFTLESLRQLRREGKMSDEEFERARAAMLNATGGSVPPVQPSTPPAKTPTLSPKRSAQRGDSSAPTTAAAATQATTPATPVRPSALGQTPPDAANGTRIPNPPKRPSQLD